MHKQQEYRIGLEWFRNESEKEFDGITLLKGESAEGLVESIPSLVKHINMVAESHLTESVLISSLVPTKFTPELAALVRNKLVWYHIMHKPTIDSLPKTMFESQPEPLDAPEKSFEQIMGDTFEPTSEPQRLPETDLFFTADGNPIASIPDFWALQAGIL